MAKCQFSTNYYDYEKGKEVAYDCPEQDPQYILGSGLSIFHDKHFLDDDKNRKIIQEEFQKKIENHLSGNNMDPLFCIGYHLADIHIERKVFANSVYFNQAELSGSVTINSKFLNCVIFTNAYFSADSFVSFGGAQFEGSGNVIFMDAQFSGYVYFDKTKFSVQMDVSFLRTWFSGPGVSFEGAEFSRGDVSFEGAEFSGVGDVSFIGTHFSGGIVNFMDTKFSRGGDVSFARARFSANLVEFSGANFSVEGHVYFTRAHFSGAGDVSFARARFSGVGDVSFAGAEFSVAGDVSFRGVQFSGRGSVAFSRAKFLAKGNIIFVCAKFASEGYIDFTYVIFSGEGDVYFLQSEFSSKEYISFGGTKFSGRVFFTQCKFKTDVYFEYVQFISPDGVQFETEDISNVSFRNTDISRIFFGENTLFGKLESKKRFEILDERRFEKCISKDERLTDSKLKEVGLSLGSILTSYRYLRENYEYRLRYDEVGQFFINEMELKRKYREQFSTNERKYIPKENKWFRRNFSFIGLYHNICNYGESSTRPLILFGIIMLLSTTYWFVTAEIGLPLQRALVSLDCNEHIILCSFERTLGDVVGFPDKGIIIDFITRISSIILLATLFLPFRRKFERRFRH